MSPQWEGSGIRILVTGANGFVGKNIVPQLSIHEDLQVTASDVTSAKATSKVAFVPLDITNDTATLQALRGIDIVVHLATHQLLPSLKDPLSNAKVNILGLLNILEAARKTGTKKIIFTSASSIIGDVSYSPVDEKHPCHPKTPYAVTKLASEQYLEMYKNLFGIDYLIFRFFNIYGPYQLDGIIPNTYRKISTGAEIDIFGDGRQMRDFVFIHDIGEIFARAILSDIKNLIVNIGTGKGTTIIELVELAGRILGKRTKLKMNPARPGEIQNFVANTDLLRSTFGLVPNTSIEKGLMATFEWLRGPN